MECHIHIAPLLLQMILLYDVSYGYVFMILKGEVIVLMSVPLHCPPRDKSEK